jgi:hypothetical protein
MRNTDRIESIRSHHRKVLLDLRRIVIFAFFCVGPERTIGDAFDVKFFIAGVNELTCDVWPN